MINRYRIATWNLERPKTGTEKSKLALAKIVEINADILVLTETSDAINLTEIYPFSISSESYERTPTEHWVTVCSKWEISEQIKTFDNFRTASGIVCTPFGNLIVFGTIIPYHMAGVSGERYGSLGFKTWEFHEKDLIAQGENWKKLLKESNLPLMVIGDFNQTRGTSKGYGTQKVRDQLTGILKNLEMTCVTEVDFTGDYLTKDPRTGRTRSNIDHICISNSLINRMNGYNVGAWDHFTREGKYMSDHNGVLIDFEI